MLLDILHPNAGNNSDAIPLVIAHMGYLVVNLLKTVEGELLIFTLRLLNTKSVHIIGK